jgi:N6-adenosine-specific RNA methylase IME4
MMQPVVDIDLQLCYSSPRARAVDPAVVAALSASIAECGLLMPITVRKVQKSRAGQMIDAYEVVAGAHRVKAFRQLGSKTIPAIVLDVDDLHAELMPIDENLCRNDLSPAERASAVARRKAIHVELYGSPKAKGAHAANGAMGHEHDASAKLADAFTSETADATGQSERTIQRDAKRGEVLGEAALAKVSRTSLDKGDELDALAKLSPDCRENLISRAVSGEKVSAKAEVKKEYRAARERDLGEKQRDLPDGRCGLIYVDVPRHFKVRSDETGLDRSPENHYPTMSFGQLAAFSIDEVAADDCVCVYWSTAASLIDDIEIMAEWGFVLLRPRDPAGKLVRDPEALMLHDGGDGRYCSMQVWDKIKVGLGYWFRDRHEFILIGVRGKPVPPAPGTQDESIFAEARGEHSAKPKHVAEMIERLRPNTPKIELFCRGPGRPGWKVWGNEAVAPFTEKQAA